MALSTDSLCTFVCLHFYTVVVLLGSWFDSQAWSLSGWSLHVPPVSEWLTLTPAPALTVLCCFWRLSTTQLLFWYCCFSFAVTGALACLSLFLFLPLTPCDRGVRCRANVESDPCPVRRRWSFSKTISAGKKEHEDSNSSCKCLLFWQWHLQTNTAHL